MALREAASNIARCFLFQLQLRGNLLRRLTCVFSYYLIYCACRILRRPQDDCRLAALKILAAAGISRWKTAVRTPSGVRLETDCYAASFMLKELLADGMYELDAEFRPKTGWTVVDVGAHHGFFALAAAQAVGPRGRVLAIEAAGANFEKLRRNVELNKLENILIARVAAADKRGRATLYLEPHISGSNSIVYKPASPHETEEIATDTLDRIVDSHNMGRVNLVKIDVEGAALTVLAGAKKTLGQKPWVVLEVEGGAAELSAVESHLRSAGYAITSAGHILYAKPQA